MLIIISQSDNSNDRPGQRPTDQHDVVNNVNNINNNNNNVNNY